MSQLIIIFQLTSFLFLLQFDGFIDLDGYDAIAMRLRGDGRCYISTVSFMRILTFPFTPVETANVVREKGCYAKP